jgi:hypothetical protein
MLRLAYKARLNYKIRAKCERHPTYDPSADENNFLRDRCSKCREILDVYESYLALEKAVKYFERRVAPWEGTRKTTLPFAKTGRSA